MKLNFDGAFELLGDKYNKTHFPTFGFKNKNPFEYSLWLNNIQYSGSIAQTIPFHDNVMFNSLDGMARGLIMEKKRHPNAHKSFPTLFHGVSLSRMELLYWTDQRMAYWQMGGHDNHYNRYKGVRHTSKNCVSNFHWFMLLALSNIDIRRTKRIHELYNIDADSLFVLKNLDIIFRLKCVNMIYGFSPSKFSNNFFIKFGNLIDADSLYVQTRQYEEATKTAKRFEDQQFIIDKFDVESDGEVNIGSLIRAGRQIKEYSESHLFGQIVADSFRKFLTKTF